jgi:hypothetical protein
LSSSQSRGSFGMQRIRGSMRIVPRGMPAADRPSSELGFRLDRVSVIGISLERR